MGGGRQINTERPGSIGGVFRQSAHDELNVGARGVFHRSDQVDEPVRAFANGLAVRSVDGHAVDENGAQVAILRRALGRNVRHPTGRQEGVQYGVGNVEVQLKPGFET